MKRVIEYSPWAKRIHHNNQCARQSNSHAQGHMLQQAVPSGSELQRLQQSLWAIHQMLQVELPWFLLIEINEILIYFLLVHKVCYFFDVFFEICLMKCYGHDINIKHSYVAACIIRKIKNFKAWWMANKQGIVILKVANLFTGRWVSKEKKNHWSYFEESSDAQ